MQEHSFHRRQDTSHKNETPSETMHSLVREVYARIWNYNDRSLSEGWHQYRDLSFQITETQRAGKQQPVFFLTVQFPTGHKKTIVCKRDGLHMHQEQKTSPVLQKLFPRIYFEVDDIAAIEPIRGLEGDRFSHFFQKHPRLIPALAKRSIQLSEELIDAGWQFVDINFARGHNVMLDDTGRLRLFDIHSIAHRTSSRETSQLDFFARAFPGRNGDRRRPFSEEDLYNQTVFMEQVRAYLALHGSLPRAVYTKKLILAPSHPRFATAFAELSQTTDPESIIWIEETTVGEMALHPGMVEACLRGDNDQLYALYLANDESVYAPVGQVSRTLTADW